MARIHGDSARIYVNEFNLSGRANRSDLEMDIPNAEVTAFEDVAQEFVQGKNQRGWSFNASAFTDFASGEIDEIINALLAAGPDDDWGIYFTGSAAGSRGYEGRAGFERETLRAPRDNAHMLDIAVRGAGDGFIGRAMKLDEATAITTTSTQTGQNHMVATDGDQIISIARITAVDGAGSVTIRLEESTNDGGGDPYGTVLTHVAMTAVGSKRQTVTASSMPGPWFRTIITAYSGFTSVTLRHAVAIVPES